MHEFSKYFDMHKIEAFWKQMKLNVNQNQFTGLSLKKVKTLTFKKSVPKQLCGLAHIRSTQAAFSSNLCQMKASNTNRKLCFSNSIGKGKGEKMFIYWGNYIELL